MKNNILNDIIQDHSSCLVIPHQSPDGDCLGSSFALSKFLTKHNCFNEIVMDDLIPTNYHFLKLENMRTSDDIIQSKKTYDYIIILDTSSPDRVGAKPDVLTLGQHTVVIDHHKTNSNYGDTNIVEMKSSVGEIIYNMFMACDQTIDADMAIGLYTSIVTDTGEFRYSNTEASSLKAVARLFETGFDFETINRHIYSNQPIEKVLLKSQSLANMKLVCNRKVSIMSVTQKMLETLSCEMFHSDGIVEAGRDIEGVEVSVLLKEMASNQIKVSLRSKAYVDVSEISLVFNGGGHARAAGCTLKMNLKEATDRIIQLIEEKI